MGWFTRKQPPQDFRNEEYKDLSGDRKRRVDAAIDHTEKTGNTVNDTQGGEEVYTYPHPGGGTAWGVNGGKHGFNVKRGVVPKDGKR